MPSPATTGSASKSKRRLRRGAPKHSKPTLVAWRSWAAALACAVCAQALGYLVACVHAKTVTGSFQLDSGDLYHGPEKEIAKYSFMVGRGRIAGKFWYRDPHTWMTSPALYLFRDESWDKYHNAPVREGETGTRAWCTRTDAQLAPPRRATTR